MRPHQCRPIHPPSHRNQPVKFRNNWDAPTPSYSDAGNAEQRLTECLRDCLKILNGAVFAERAGWRGATKENIPGGSSTEEQRSQPAFSAKTLRAAGLLSVAGVGSDLTAHCGDARPSPPCPQPKSLAAAPLAISKQALKPKRPLPGGWQRF